MKILMMMNMLNLVEVKVKDQVLEILITQILTALEIQNLTVQALIAHIQFQAHLVLEVFLVVFLLD